MASIDNEFHVVRRRRHKKKSISHCVYQQSNLSVAEEKSDTLLNFDETKFEKRFKECK